MPGGKMFTCVKPTFLASQCQIQNFTCKTHHGPKLLASCNALGGRYNIKVKVLRPLLQKPLKPLKPCHNFAQVFYHLPASESHPTGLNVQVSLSAACMIL